MIYCCTNMEFITEIGGDIMEFALSSFKIPLMVMGLKVNLIGSDISTPMLAELVARA